MNDRNCGVYELWASESETSLFMPDAQTEASYKLNTSIDDGRPMELVVRFYSPNFEMAKRYRNYILGYNND